MRLLQVEIFKGSGRHPWFLRIVAGNGETLATSEGYYSKWNVLRAARKNFPGLKIVERDR